jgi:hypothetical protein
MLPPVCHLPTMPHTLWTSKRGIDVSATAATTQLSAWLGKMWCKVCALTCHPPPPCCNHCILGKQTHLSVPNVQEGNKASCPLERVFVDLCGPMLCRSRSNCLYSMNLIDDFSSYAWSLPLKSKDKATSVLQLWHRAVENQSGHHLKILVSDNGELISKSMQD